jgi:hypothetical protein
MAGLWLPSLESLSQTQVIPASPQPASLAIPIVGTRPNPFNHSLSPAQPVYADPNDRIRQQNEAIYQADQAQYDAQIKQKRQAQSTIQEAVTDFSRRTESGSTVLKESDLSKERKAQLYVALRRYEQVYQELTPMYLGKQPYNLKRAVYLVENAYLDNAIPYEDFCRKFR